MRDAPVRDCLVTLTTLGPPAAAVFSLWTEQYYGAQAAAAIDLIGRECDKISHHVKLHPVQLSLDIRHVAYIRPDHMRARRHILAARTAV
mgnify:CR=1 FL=1